ncbi:hypothetical protein DN752_01225 [Echinicola strongylocentroti]|uniref:Uncharacterized protein n=1 Tax=Echinicola strongylocentroti TaxID=1795355 RepID=A0A2Z4IDG7_9BACT|nr:hypothetical protein DN752_01225 [Echinicola strongylocentroti]
MLLVIFTIKVKKNHPLKISKVGKIVQTFDFYAINLSSIIILNGTQITRIQLIFADYFLATKSRSHKEGE